MFEELSMTPRELYKLICSECKDRYDTIEYDEVSQSKHVIVLTRAGELDINVVCMHPYSKQLNRETVENTISHIKDIYSEREIVWW